MTNTYNFSNNNGQDGVMAIGNFNYETRIQFQLKSGQSVRIAKERNELLQDPLNGANGGLEITAQMGIVELWWIGPLWARGDSNGAVMTHMVQGCRYESLQQASAAVAAK